MSHGRWSCPSVIEQTGACPPVTLMYDPTVSVENNRFLFTGLQPAGEGWEHFCLEPCSFTRPSTFLALHQAISQNMPQSSPYFYCFLSQLCKQFFIPFEMYTCGFRSCYFCYFFTAAFLFGVWDMLSYCSGTHVPYYTGLWWSPGGSRPTRVASLYVLR